MSNNLNNYLDVVIVAEVRTTGSKTQKGTAQNEHADEMAFAVMHEMCVGDRENAAGYSRISIDVGKE